MWALAPAGWFVAGTTVGILANRLFSMKHRNGENAPAPLALDGEQKMVMAVRADLKMGKGKIGAQCGHAALGAFLEATKKQPAIVRSWEQCGQTKIVVQAKDEEELLALQREAKKRALVTCLIHDAGRTQIPAGSSTVLAVGPGPADLVDQVTGSCKLL